MREGQVQPTTYLYAEAGQACLLTALAEACLKRRRGGQCLELQLSYCDLL